MTPGGCELGEGVWKHSVAIIGGEGMKGQLERDRKPGKGTDGGSRECTPEQHLLGYLKTGCNYTLKNYLARRINIVRSVQLCLLVSTASRQVVCFPFPWQGQHSPPELGFAVVFTPCPTQPVPNPSGLLARDV